MAFGHATRTTLAFGHATRTTLAFGHATRTTFPTPSTKGEQVVTFTIQLPSSQFSLNCDAMW
ncbi:MAG: hypothetical protein F6K51_05605 [Moorea sp. SIO3I8]|nr:hypothetical protein [Moorena sp. SIO3I8]